MAASPPTAAKDAAPQVAPAKNGKPRGISDRNKKGAATKAKEFAAKIAALQAASEPLGYRLMSKPEICALVGASYPAIWQWMRDGKFPRPRAVFGRSMWLSTEIEQWLGNLPVRRLKGDAPDDHACKP
jgi:predicted DNA-binding transcriptional regulator AlpA